MSILFTLVLISFEPEGTWLGCMEQGNTLPNDMFNPDLSTICVAQVVATEE